MKNIASVRRMASDIAGCGKNKLWFNPNEYEKILAADSKERVRELLNSNVIIQKLDKVNSRAAARKRAVAKSKGRHRGLGKRKGTKNARMPEKKLWTRTLRSMRKILKEMKVKGELSCEEHRRYRQMAKGNLFRLNKNVMIKFIEKKKEEEKRIAEIKEQANSLKVSGN